MDLKEAVKVFAQGFATARSRTHPYLARRLGPLWYLADGPRKDPRKNRAAEFIACGSRPATVMKYIEKVSAARWGLCVIHAGIGRDAGIEAAYKSLGLRYVSHEGVFVSDRSASRNVAAGSLQIRKVTDLEDARRVAVVAKSRQLPEADVGNDSARPRLFAAFESGEPVGWVTSVGVGTAYAWVQNLYVLPTHRRRGVGRALMIAMRRDDTTRDVTHSVLTASAAGARLYPKIGYQQVGTLLFFRPPKRKS